MALPRLPFVRDAVSVAEGKAVLHRRLLTPLFHLRQSGVEAKKSIRVCLGEFYNSTCNNNDEGD